LKFFSNKFGGRDGLKKKLDIGSRRIEAHKREVIVLRTRLESRHKSLFEEVVKAIGKKDDNNASVFAVELSEIKKVLRVVRMSELALTQIIVRIESIRDVGDVFANMNESFKIMRSINKSVSGVVPDLENASDEVNSTLTETLTNLGNLSPAVSLDLNNEGGEELFEKAKLFAEEKANEYSEDLPSSLHKNGYESILDQAEKVSLLATGSNHDEPEFQPTLLSRPKESNDVYDRVFKYISNQKDGLNVIGASIALNLPVEEIEKVVIKLASEGRLKIGCAER
jgi:division protein CdvB (Snf7/Vps24/ESCRT-III family)